MNKPSIVKPVSALFRVIGLALCLAAAGSLILTGCIENPRPDSGLGSRNLQYRHVASAVYGDNMVLECHIRQDSGKTYLRLLSLVPGRLDSARYYLQIVDAVSDYGPPIVAKRVRFEYVGKVDAMDREETADVGAIDDSVSYDVEDLTVLITLLQVSINGQSSSPTGGVYIGTYAGLDTAAVQYKGTVKGVVNADGKFGFQVEATSRQGFTGKLHGLTYPNGLLSGNITFDDIFNGKVASFDSSRFKAAGSGLEADFRFLHPARWLDSLGFTLERYQPR
jgi:hypothetical protein